MEKIILWIILFIIALIFADRSSKLISRLLHPFKFRGKGYLDQPSPRSSIQIIDQKIIISEVSNFSPKQL